MLERTAIVSKLGEAILRVSANVRIDEAATLPDSRRSWHRRITYDSTRRVALRCIAHTTRSRFDFACSCGRSSDATAASSRSRRRFRSVGS